jgi:hypothetical protein
MKAMAVIGCLVCCMAWCHACDKKKEEKSPYAQALETICYAPQKAGVEGIEDPAEKAVKIAQYISANLRDQKAAELMQSMAAMPPDVRGATLLEEARKAGLKECPLVETMGKP